MLSLFIIGLCFKGHLIILEMGTIYKQVSKLSWLNETNPYDHIPYYIYLLTTNLLIN